MSIQLSRYSSSLKVLWAVVASTTLFSFNALAREFKVGDLKLDHPFSRATPPGAKAAGGFVKIQNVGAKGDKLISASADVSEAVELHTMKVEFGVMRMRQVDSIDIAANSTTDLKPGGLHIMFMGLKKPLKEGDRFPVTLKFENAGEVKIEVAVEKMMSTGNHKH